MRSPYGGLGTFLSQGLLEALGIGTSQPLTILGSLAFRKALGPCVYSPFGDTSSKRTCLEYPGMDFGTGLDKSILGYTRYVLESSHSQYMDPFSLTAFVTLQGRLLDLQRHSPDFAAGMVDIDLVGVPALLQSCVQGFQKPVMKE